MHPRRHRPPYTVCGSIWVASSWGGACCNDCGAWV